MSEWQSYSLAELADIRVSNVDKKSKPDENLVRLCNYMDVYSNDYITANLAFMESTASSVECAKFKVDKGDVLITKDSETPYDIGIPSVVIDEIENLVCGYHLALIKPNREKVNSIFLSKQLAAGNVSSYFSRMAAGSTRYGLSNGTIARTKVILPSLAKQHKIAKVLLKIDRTIAHTEALIAKYQQIKAGLMHDLFTRGIGADGKLRPPRDQAPELYRESAIGWIPKEWKLEHLADACDWYSGGTPSRRHTTWWNGDVPWLSPKDMKVFDLSETQEHVTKLAALVGSRIMPKNTVFIVIRGMILAHSFPVVYSEQEFCFNQDIKAIYGRGSLNNRFLAYWFVANKNLFLKKTTESTHGTKRFDMKDIYDLHIGIPSNEEQSLFLVRLDYLNTKLQLEQASLDKLKLQKSGLMHDLLTGKVQVKTDLPEAPHG
jgi:type I restriction enzyme, S subunit